MDKIDFKKELKHLYRPSAKKIEIVDVPAMNFLLADGAGRPGSAEYTQIVEALYTLSYTLKFMIKKGDIGVDYGVMPLEGLWWAEDMNDYIEDNRDNWLYTMMIMQPHYVTPELVAQATDQARKKKNPAALSKVRFESFTEGLTAQTLHIGPFSEEGPTIEGVHQFIAENGAQLSGKHHEIYLSDIRRAAPKNWRTIIRQPFTQG